MDPDEVERFQAHGVFDGQRWELVAGELYDKMSQNPPNSNARRRLVEWLRTLFQPGTVDTRCPIQTAAADREYSLPEPDAVVFIHPVLENRHTRADEVLLVAEVSDTSLRFDISVKAGLYPDPPSPNTGSSIWSTAASSSPAIPTRAFIATSKCSRKPKRSAPPPTPKRRSP